MDVVMQALGFGHGEAVQTFFSGMNAILRGASAMTGLFGVGALVAFVGLAVGWAARLVDTRWR